MNLQQLLILREAVRRDLNLTDVAAALFTSQPGVSKHHRDLEDELGVDLFVRHGKRMLADAENVKRIAADYADQNSGELIVAATHTQARYALPQVIQRFRASCEADLGVATEALDGVPRLANFPCYVWNHAVIVPKDRPLVRLQQLTLPALSGYPIVTYHAGFTGRGLVKLDASHLFAPNVARLAVRRGNTLRGFAYRFIQELVPSLDPASVNSALGNAARCNVDLPSAAFDIHFYIVYPQRTRSCTWQSGETAWPSAFRPRSSMPWP